MGHIHTLVLTREWIARLSLDRLPKTAIGPIVVFGDIAENGNNTVLGIPRADLEDFRVQYQNSIKDNILKLHISCFKNLPRISGAIHS